MKVFFDVDGVLIDGWHCNPDRRIPWDLTIESDLGIRREALQQGLFQRQSDGSGSLMQACVSGRLDLKEVLTELLPALGYDGGADALADYWFTKDSRINSDVLDAVERLGSHTGVDVYLATGQEHHRAAYLWNELGLSRHFRDMFYSARLGRLKGTPDFFVRSTVSSRSAPTSGRSFSMTRIGWFGLREMPAGMPAFWTRSKTSCSTHGCANF